MKHLVVEPRSVLRALTCDRCKAKAEHPDAEFFEFTSIGHKAGYASIFGDGNQVEIDLCQACLQATLGHWLRVREDDQTTHPPANLESFDPAARVGE